MCRQHYPQVKTHPRQAGYSLLGLSVIVLIIGFMTVVIVPDTAPTDLAKLELAAQLTADAMRFARNEAMRRGEPIGFRQQNGQQRMRVYRLDTGSSPWTTVFDIYHPVSKKIYDIRFDQQPFAEADTVSANRDFRGSCNTPSNVYFDSGGTARCADPETVLVNSYQVVLTLGGHTRSVSLDGLSGKVTVQ